MNNTRENKYKISASKGYYGVMKGIVTRNILHMPKPVTEKWSVNQVVSDSTVSNNRWDVQVWIPGYHGGDKPDEKKIGTASDFGEYPWAQVCGPLFKDNIGKGESYNSVWESMFYGTYMQDVPTTYPAIGDVVFLMFENGDISLPICIGSLMCDSNRIETYDESKISSGSVVSNVDMKILETVNKFKAAAGAKLMYPLDAVFPVSSPYGWRDPIPAAGVTTRNFHNGIDLDVPNIAHGFQPRYVIAAHDGTATGCQTASGFGIHVILKGSLLSTDGPEIPITTKYGHLSALVNLGVGESKKVKAGDIIGRTGTTGSSSGDHLHFGVYTGNSITLTDPVSGRTTVTDTVDPAPLLAISVK